SILSIQDHLKHTGKPEEAAAKAGRASINSETATRSKTFTHLQA
ncbi:MAG: hypothetical protein ACI9G6_002389, partial [Limisphaerales bacterium]